MTVYIHNTQLHSVIVPIRQSLCWFVFKIKRQYDCLLYSQYSASYNHGTYKTNADFWGLNESISVNYIHHTQLHSVMNETNADLVSRLWNESTVVYYNNTTALPGCRWWCLWWHLFVLSFFTLDVLDEIWDLIESVSEGFPTYSYSDMVPIRQNLCYED